MSLTRASSLVVSPAKSQRHETTGGGIVGSQTVRQAVTIKVICLMLALWGLVLIPRIAWGPRYYMDSSQYVECARSIMAGQGFTHRPQRGLENTDSIPMTLWPPGYPLLIAATMIIGLAAPLAALAVPIASSFVCVWLIAHLYHRWLPPLLVVPATLATILMPVFSYASGMALSEAPCLAASLASIACLLQWTESRNQRIVWLLLAGLAGGIAWCFRNSTVGLFAASFLFVVSHAYWLPLWHVAKSLLAWCVGWGVGCGWLVLYNLIKFGKINPYHMPPSDLGLWGNLRQTWHVLVADLTGSVTVADWLNSKYIMAATGLVIVGITFLCLRNAKQWTVAAICHRYRKELFLATYFVATIAITVIARSVYRWGEWINSRHFYPVYWIVWLFVALIVWELARRLLANQKVATVIAGVIVSLLALVQAESYRQTLRDYQIGKVAFHNLHTTWQDERIVRAVSELIRKDQIVLTDSADYLRILGDIHARRFVRPRHDSQPEITLEDVQRSAANGLFWGFVIWDREACESGKFGSMIQQLLRADDLPGNFERVELGDGYPVLWKVRVSQGRDEK